MTIHRSEFSTSLLFHPLLTSHTGNYTCQVNSLQRKDIVILALQATNSAGTYEVDGVLLVQAPPRWVQEPEDAEVLLLFSALHNFETFFVVERLWLGRSCA